MGGGGGGDIMVVINNLHKLMKDKKIKTTRTTI